METPTATEKKKGLPSFATPLAVFLWLYIPFNTFIFNIDIAIFNLMGIDTKYLFFKYIISAALFTFILIKYKSVKILWMFLYILLFPLYIAFLVIPMLLIIKGKFSWLIAYSWNAISFLISARKRTRRLLISIIAITFCVIKLELLNYLGIGLCLYMLLSHIFDRMVLIRTNKWLPAGEADTIVNYILKERGFEKKMADLGDEKPDDLTLSQMVLYSSLVRYTGNNSKRFNKSSIFVALSNYQFIATAINIILFFSLINFSLYNISPSNFKISGTPSIFDFVFYTFFNVAYAQVDDIKVNSVSSKVFSMLQIALQIFIVPMLVSFFTTFYSSKVSRDLEAISDAAKTRDEEISRKSSIYLSQSLMDLRDKLYDKGDILAAIAVSLDGDKNITFSQALEALKQPLKETSEEKKVIKTIDQPLPE